MKTSKKLPFIMALVPSIAAFGLMAKMSADQKNAAYEKHREISSLESRLSDQADAISSVNRLCKSDVNCPELIISRFEEMKSRIESLTARLQEKHASLVEQKASSEEKEQAINSLEASLRKANDTLRITRQTVDAQISLELEAVEEQIDEIRSEYESIILSLQQDLRDARISTQNEVKEKEDKFRELHKKSINSLLGMVDSLAQDRQSRIIPLISTYDDETVKDKFICSDAGELSPSEMIFSRHMERHWLIWPVTVITSNQDSLIAETGNGYSLDVQWENKENLYELSSGDKISIQFQPLPDQKCDSPITGRRAVFTTH